MKVIQSQFNGFDFQSRVIEVKEKYNWSSFVDKIINHPLDDYIPDQELIDKSCPLLLGVMLPKRKKVKVLQNDEYHLMIETVLWNDYKTTLMFYLT